MAFMEHINWNALCAICTSNDKNGEENNNQSQNYTNVALSDTNANNNANNHQNEMYQQNNRAPVEDGNGGGGGGDLLKVEGGAGMTRSNVSGYSGFRGWKFKKGPK